MPQFELNGKEKPEFTALPEIVQGFIEAMFFTECAGSHYTMKRWFFKSTQKAIADGQADGSLPADCGFAELPSDSLTAIIKFCEEFETKARDYLEIAYDLGYDAEQAGRDLWFTSQGHGVGFWDRDILEFDIEGKSLGDILSDLAGRHEINPDFDGKFVYVDI